MKGDCNTNVHEISLTCCLDQASIVDSENQVHALRENTGAAEWSRGYFACIFFSYNLAAFLTFQCWKWLNSHPHITVSQIPTCIFWTEGVLSEYVQEAYKGSCLLAYFVTTVFFHCASEQYIHLLLGTHNKLPELICQLWRGFLCSIESGAHTLCGYTCICIYM